jgi:hypothetical protein
MVRIENMKELKLKNDVFKKVRGGHSRLLEIICQQCGESICLYQKDGSGSLKRMYIDRIINPQYLFPKKIFRVQKDTCLV